jgi:hypothetical protein
MARLYIPHVSVKISLINVRVHDARAIFGECYAFDAVFSRRQYTDEQNAFVQIPNVWDKVFDYQKDKTSVSTRRKAPNQRRRPVRQIQDTFERRSKLTFLFP